jgi:hypothetical protein
MAYLDYFGPGHVADELPAPTWVARALLWFLSISTLIGSITWYLDGTSAQSLGQAIAVATPGGIGVYLALRFPAGKGGSGESWSPSARSTSSCSSDESSAATFSA